MSTANFEIFYYVDEKGIAPVREYLSGLPEGQRAKIYAFINFLSEEGHRVRRPFADYLGDQTGLYELRPSPRGSSISSVTRIRSF
jgi:hypothetical protein